MNALASSPRARIRPADLDLPGVVRASALDDHSSAQASWNSSSLAGRFVELSVSESLSGSDRGSPAALTLSAALVLDAQKRGEPAAWVTSTTSTFFPPDVAEHGIDLDALVVVRLPDAAAIPRAGATLLRSGAFGLLVLDLGRNATMPTPLQARLVKLSQQRHATVLCLTVKSPEDSSIGSMVSLRGTAVGSCRKPGSYTCEVRILKDKHRAATWTHREEYRGPVGLC